MFKALKVAASSPWRCKSTALYLFMLTLWVSIIMTSTASAEPTQATVDTGTTAWMLTSTTLVLLMIPGLAMFYGGLVRTKNVIGTMMHSFAAMAIIGVLWPIIGYALAFGESVNGFIGWRDAKFFLSGIDQSITDTMTGPTQIANINNDQSPPTPPRRSNLRTSFAQSKWSKQPLLQSRV